MFAEADLSSGEESTEMENISETTRLVSGKDAKELSPDRAARSPSPSTPHHRNMTRTDGSHVNRGLELDRCTDSDSDSASWRQNGEDKRSTTPGGSQPKTTAYVVLLAAFAAIGGFLFGYDTGVVSGAMLLLKDEFSLSSLEQEMVVSVTIGAAFVAALFGGFMSDQFGRKICTISASIVFTAGAVVLGVAQNVVMLIVGRLTLGLGIGIASMTVPVYIAEVAPPHLRGRLLTINVLFITGGQFVASLLDGAFSYLKKDGWRYMLGLAGVPSFIQLIGFLFLPESPRFLMKKGKEEQARQVLVAVRGTKDVEEEVQEIRENCRQDEEATRHSQGPTILLMLRSSNMRRALVVGCGLQLFQQLSGINTVMYYSASIIKMAGVTNQHTAIWLAAMTAGVNFVFTLVGVWLVERIGRKPLLLSSLAGVVLSLAVLAVGFQLNAFNSPPITFNETLDNSTCFSYSSCESCIEDKGCGFCYPDTSGDPANGSCVAVAHDDAYSQAGRCSANSTTLPGMVWAYEYCPTPYSWIAIFGLALYLMFFAPGMGPMPWTINAEIYPMWARSTGNSMSAATNWIANLLVSMTFLTLTETLTKYGTYWLFVGIATLGFVFLLCLLPETKGKKLEDVEELFAKPWCACGQGDQSVPVSSHPAAIQ
ncbi:proton myo-inositol cotransporter-like [Babylonia areolata]|uniref:proton myo-inositol cotransporter-like n=1 Tax=Babylonia areolata TaxID=304850 RepID=UPI003FD15EEF